MGTNPRAGLPRIAARITVMKTSTLTLVDGTSALAPSAQLEAELLKDRWDARTIRGHFSRFSLSAIQVFVRFKTWWSKTSTHFSLIYAQRPTPVGKRRATAK